MGTSPRRYPDAFRAEAVDLVRAGARSLPRIARDLGITDQTLRNWVTQAEIDVGRGQPGALTTDERTELTRLRREVRILQQEREILKKAAAFFAKETS
jgi:transposase